MKKKKLSYLLPAAVLFMPLYLFSQDNEKLIKDYISSNKLKEYKKQDLANFIVENVDSSKSLKGEVIKLQQTYNGLPVHGSAGAVLIRENKIIYYTDNFIKDYHTSVSKTGVDKKNALEKIAAKLGKREIMNYPILGFFDPNPEKHQVVKQRPVYKKHKDDLILCYEFIMPEPKSANYWDILVNAGTGEIISQINLTSYCNLSPDVYSRDFSNSKDIGNDAFSRPLNKKEEQPTSLLPPDNASYNVFALPIESVTFGNRSIVNNPWILSASPEGWHSDGTNHYTITRGNNIFAFKVDEDIDANPDAFYSPNGGQARVFNYPFNFNASPLDNQDAAITNVFYVCNKAHDIFYQLGFTESARNFQENNFGNGGLGNDAVWAYAQSGEDINNAYFVPTPEGEPAGLNMFVWSNVKRLYYNAPGSAISHQPAAKIAPFGPALSATGITGEVQLANVLSGCTSLSPGSLTNKIALIKGLTTAEMTQQPSCGFINKVKNAQNAGAIGVIMYNDNDSSQAIPVILGADPTITIPSVLIENSEGEYIKNLLSAGTPVNITLKSSPTDYTPDGSFDNGIIIHEYGHGVSQRLTGTGYDCLLSNVSTEQMGEGWSDFFALMLTNKTGDNTSIPRGVGTYVMGQSTTGAGTRPSKYSTDFTINNYTYEKTNGMDNSHSIGFVWATMLWDLHWKYVEKYGYSSDIMTNATNGSTRVLQLVIDALKLQPCNPTFIEGRDAILAADQATTGGEDKCMIWKAFARRGLGLNASAGSKTNINDQVEDFTVPVECNTTLAADEVMPARDSVSIYPNPAKNEFFIKFASRIMGKANIEIYDMSGKLVYSEGKISPDTPKTISTERLENGTYLIKVSGLGYEATSKILIKR
jgi:hypothetical protein